MHAYHPGCGCAQCCRAERSEERRDEYIAARVAEYADDEDTLRARYGGEFGQRCLLARRLAEVGVPMMLALMPLLARSVTASTAKPSGVVPNGAREASAGSASGSAAQSTTSFRTC